jgi:phenylpropionate dioxygenase-like ring-hydroxylating dioxygenase large terminal subunit
MKASIRSTGPSGPIDSLIAQSIAQHQKGHSLPSLFYAHPDIYARDLERIFFKHWLCVGHESRIPKPGDFFVYEIAGESLIVVRGRDGEIRTLANVCRHRGSHVCYEQEGHAKVLVCPYHAWSYELDGTLRSTRYADKDFDKSKYSLARLHTRIIQGLILVSFAEHPPKLDDAERTLGASLGVHGWPKARVARRQVYTVDANWKLAIENYYECYHCGPAHPEFARHHASEKPLLDVAELRAQGRSALQQRGIEIPDAFHWPWPSEPGQESVDCFHDATYPGSVTGSEDGQPVAPLMGDFTDYHGGFTYADIGPVSFFLAYSDYGVMYLFIPRDVQKTDMEVIWLVDEKAQEGVDYELSKLTWMWDVTSVADKRIIDHNQKGVNSRFYRPGPYHEMEFLPKEFTEWYLSQIGAPSRA